MVSNVSGKLASLNRQLFKSRHGNTSPFVADLLAHEVNFAEIYSSFAIWDENFERSEKDDQFLVEKHLEQDSKIHIQSNFSSPVALQLFSSVPIRDRKLFSFDDKTVKEGAFVYLVIHRNSDNFSPNQSVKHFEPNDSYSACIYHRYFKYVNVRAEVNFSLDYDRESQIKKLCTAPLHQHLMITLILGRTNISNSRHIIDVYFNPKVRKFFTLGMLLQDVKSADAMNRFVQVELNNPTAIPNGHRYFPGYFLPLLVEFCNDRAFSNETLQLIEDACQPHYRNDGLFVVSPKEIVKKLAVFIEDSYPSIRSSSCPMNIQVEVKTEYPKYPSEVTLYNY